MENKSEHAIYSQGMEVDYSQTSFSDTPQLSLLSGMDMPAKSSENERQMDGFQTCECGKGTLDCSIHPSTPEAWTLFMRDSLARILALPGNKQELAQKHAVASTVKSSASLAWFDQDSCSWKTSQQSLLTDSQQSWQTLPRSGMTRNGFAYELPTVGRAIIETGGLHWPTPDTRGFVNDGSLSMLAKKCDSREEMFAIGHRASAKKKEKYWPTPRANAAMAANITEKTANARFPNLETVIARQIFPTPNASDCRDRGNMSMPSIQRRAAIGKQLNLSMVVHPTSGQLNPTWVEWLMGFPIGFTVSKDWVMPKSHSKQQSPTNSLEVSK